MATTAMGRQVNGIDVDALAAVVREIEAGSAEPDMPGRLKERFRDSSGVIEREAAAFIAELRTKGLLEE